MSAGSGYDYNPVTYSNEGRMFQVEYAGKAVEKGGTAIGVKCSDGVVLGVEKVLLSPMLVKTSNRRIYTVDSHIGVAVTGWAADGRVLAGEAQGLADDYLARFGERVSPSTIASQVAGQVHLCTCYTSFRPYGCSMLLAGFNDITKEVELYCIDPSGVKLRYFGCAIGKGARVAKTDIERLEMTTKTCREVLQLVAKMCVGVPTCSARARTRLPRDRDHPRTLTLPSLRSAPRRHSLLVVSCTCCWLSVFSSSPHAFTAYVQPAHDARLDEEQAVRAGDELDLRRVWVAAPARAGRPEGRGGRVGAGAGRGGRQRQRRRRRRRRR